MATKREIDIANAIKQAVIDAWDNVDSKTWNSVADRAAMEAVDVEAVINALDAQYPLFPNLIITFGHKDSK